MLIPRTRRRDEQTATDSHALGLLGPSSNADYGRRSRPRHRGMCAEVVLKCQCAPVFAAEMECQCGASAFATASGGLQHAAAGVRTAAPRCAATPLPQRPWQGATRSLITKSVSDSDDIVAHALSLTMTMTPDDICGAAVLLCPDAYFCLRSIRLLWHRRLVLSSCFPRVDTARHPHTHGALVLYDPEEEKRRLDALSRARWMTSNGLRAVHARPPKWSRCYPEMMTTTTIDDGVGGADREEFRKLPKQLTGWEADQLKLPWEDPTKRKSNFHPLDSTMAGHAESQE
eukprot:3009225-Rhodomonas_salina.1